VAAAFSAGDFAAVAGRDGVHELPVAGDLPGRQAFEEELFQVALGRPRITHDEGDDGLGAFGFPAGRTEDDAFAYSRMGDEEAFDGFRRDFPAGHIDEVAKPALDKDVAVADFRKVGRLENSVA